LNCQAFPFATDRWSKAVIGIAQYATRFTTLLKKGHFNRKDAKSAKIINKAIRNIDFSGLL
jgi:hypothetical protein